MRGRKEKWEESKKKESEKEKMLRWRERKLQRKKNLKDRDGIGNNDVRNERKSKINLKERKRWKNFVMKIKEICREK